MNPLNIPDIPEEDNLSWAIWFLEENCKILYERLEKNGTRIDPFDFAGVKFGLGCAERCLKELEKEMKAEETK